MPAEDATLRNNYAAAAEEVTRFTVDRFSLKVNALYAHSFTDRHPDFTWGNGVLFSALLGAARNDPGHYRPLLDRFATALDQYWDDRAPIAGYEPAPIRQSGKAGHDKYYDDNEWMALCALEAYETTGQKHYLNRARQTVRFICSGCDQTAGGGIWWHEQHKGNSKNTCSNAPAAVACLRLAKYESPDEAKTTIRFAHDLLAWTSKTFENNDGLYADSLNVNTGQINRGQLTYNTALMIRGYLEQFRISKDPADLEQAKRSSAAADWFLNSETGTFRDPLKWSHLLVEADLALYRATGDTRTLQRAARVADADFAAWKQSPPDEMINNAALARELWLLAETQSPDGIEFWKRMDRPTAAIGNEDHAAAARAQ